MSHDAKWKTINNSKKDVVLEDLLDKVDKWADGPDIYKEMKLQKELEAQVDHIVSLIPSLEAFGPWRERCTGEIATLAAAHEGSPLSDPRFASITLSPVHDPYMIRVFRSAAIHLIYSACGSSGRAPNEIGKGTCFQFDNEVLASIGGTNLVYHYRSETKTPYNILWKGIKSLDNLQGYKVLSYKDHFDSAYVEAEFFLKDGSHVKVELIDDNTTCAGHNVRLTMKHLSV